MNSNYIGPNQRARYVGQVGQAYIDNVLQPVTVVSVRGEHKRMKLTVQLADTSTREITLNFYVEPK